jgi:hypothetical protein
VKSLRLDDFLLRAACFVAYALFSAAILVYAAVRPANNVDLIHYVGAALGDLGLQGDELHARTYAELRSALPADAYQLLTERDSYLHDMSADPESFRQNLQFFLVKPLYPALMSIVTRFGVHLPSAALAISIAAGGFLALLVYAWLAADVAEPYRAAFAAALVSGVGLLGLARLATPDALSAAVLLAAAYEYARSGNTRRAWLWLAVSILARPDNLIIAVLAVLAWATWPSSQRRFAIGEALVALGTFAATYWAAHRFAPGFSFATFFWESFVERSAYPERAYVALTMPIYARVLLRGTVRLLDPNPVLWFALLALSTVVVYRKKRLPRDPAAQVAAVMAAAWLVRFLLWPYPAPRFYAANYLVVGIVFVRSLFVAETTSS